MQNCCPRRQTGCLCPDGSRRLIGECRLTLALDMPALAEGLTLWRGDPSDSRGRFGGGAVPLGEQRRAPLRLYGMGTLWIAGVLLLAVCLGACSDQSPMAVESESGHLESAAQAESGTRPGAAATVDPSETREREGDATQAEQTEQAEPAERPAPAEAEVVEEEESVEVQVSAASDLTEVPAVVVGDAEMRVRPGLAWGVSRRLTADDEVEVLNRTSGWLRVRVDDCEGWVRSTALELGEVNEQDIIEEAAPPIIAEWRGIEYGVMGQSADAADVRLLGDSDEIASAPKDEVTLMADDITLDDLPVLIGDEMVVFPGDDFRAGQGKILPSADEWMWLPWGWLLAHNEEFIWQWRPETDELELIRRPPGQAKLSPDGSHLAIERCGNAQLHCQWIDDVVVLPLDGSETWSARSVIGALKPEQELQGAFYGRYTRVQWAANSSALLVQLALTDDFRHWLNPVMIGIDGRVTILPQVPPDIGTDRECAPERWRDYDAWLLRGDNTLHYRMACRDSQGKSQSRDYAVFDLHGQFQRIETVVYTEYGEDGIEIVRSASGGDALGESIQVFWSPSGEHALVASERSSTLWLYDTSNDRLERLDVSAGGLASYESEHWDNLNWAVRWHSDQAALVHQLVGHGQDRGAVLVDVPTGRAIAFDLGWHLFSSCMPPGDWSPRGEFALAVLGGIALGGMAPAEGGYQSLVIRRSTGVLAAELRVTARYGTDQTGTHNLAAAEWSPGGEWLAVGGSQRPHPCFFPGA